MIKSIVFYFVLCSFFSCRSQPSNPNEQIEIIPSFDLLQNRYLSNPDTTYVINFWATTCPPCLKEMPHFKELEDRFQDEKVKVILVSLDVRKDFEKRVVPFVKKHAIQTEVLLLADENYSAWTDEIDPSWFGALPATFVKNSDQTHFSFGAYETFDELLRDVLKVH